MNEHAPIALEGNLLTFTFWWRAMKVHTADCEFRAMGWFGLSRELEGLLTSRAELAVAVRRFNRATRWLMAFALLTGLCIGIIVGLLVGESMAGAVLSERHPLPLQMAGNIVLLMLGICYVWGLDLYRRLKALCVAYNQSVTASHEA